MTVQEAEWPCTKEGHLVLALTPGPSPNNWARGDRVGPGVGSPSPSFWERGPGGEGLPAGKLNSPGHSELRAPRRSGRMKRQNTRDDPHSRLSVTGAEAAQEDHRSRLTDHQTQQDQGDDGDRTASH